MEYRTDDSRNSNEEAGLELRGEKGTIYLDRSRLELHPESKHGVAPTEMILDPSMPRGRGADGNDGQRVTEFVMPWNIFNLTTKDTNYGLCTQLDP